MRVLSVCDPIVHVLVYRALKRNGDTVDEIDSSYSAYQSLRKGPYDLLIVSREVPPCRFTLFGGGRPAPSLYAEGFLGNCVDFMGHRPMPPVIILDTLQSTPVDLDRCPSLKVTVVPWPTTEDDLLAEIRRIQAEIVQGK